MSARCESCGLPVSMTKARRELLELVSAGRWFDAPDSALGRLEALERDGLVRWRDPGYQGYTPGEGYRITERGREMLDTPAGGSPGNRA